MKKILLITIFLILGTNAYSKIIEFEKCYYNNLRKETFKSFSDFNENSRITNQTILNYENNPNVKPADQIVITRGKKKDYKINGESADSYEYFNFPYKTIIFRIFAKEMKVEHLHVLSQKALDAQKKKQKRIDEIKFKFEKANKELPTSLQVETLLAEKKKLTSWVYEIQNFYDDNIIFNDKLPNGKVFRTYDLNLKTGIVAVNEGRRSYFLHCKKKGENQNYLDYWWAVILIIAITFFIFTQSGKRLKKIRRK